MDITGKALRIGETATFGSSGFRKRTIHVQTEEQYPQILEVEFVQDKVDILDNFSIGQDVVISINLRGREWTDPEGVVKVFNTIQGWKIEAKGF